MSSNESKDSLSLMEESSVDRLEYLPVEEYMAIVEEEVPQKEKLIRLMSFDLDEQESTGSSEYEEFTDICPQYWDIVSFAENFVQDIISEAEGMTSK